MKITRKAQAATEFIMTYGWAILVVLVAIGALAAFGVLSPDKFLPERCAFPAGIDCLDKATISAGDGTVQLPMKNNRGYRIVLNGISGSSAESCPSPTLVSPASGTVLSNGQQFVLTVDCGATLPQGRFKSDFVINYTQNETGIRYMHSGTVTGVAN